MTTETIDATNVAVLQGQLSGPPRRRELPSGSVLVEFDVTTRGPVGRARRRLPGSTRTRVADSLLAGEAVVVVGHVRRRFFRAGAATQSRTEVVAHARRAGHEASPGQPHPRCGDRGDRRWLMRAPGGAGQRTENPDEPVGVSSTTLDPGHVGGRWSDPAPGDGLGHVVLRALEHRLDRPVGAVAHPAGESQFDGVAPARLTEPHALHVAAARRRGSAPARSSWSADDRSATSAQVRVISLGSIDPLPLVSVPHSSRTSSAAQVSASTAPVTVSSWSAWNARTA